MSTGFKLGFEEQDERRATVSGHHTISRDRCCAPQRGGLAFVFGIILASRQAPRKFEQFVFQTKDDFFSFMIVFVADAAHLVGQAFKGRGQLFHLPL